MRASWLAFLVLGLSIPLAGCQGGDKKTASPAADAPGEEAEIEAALAKLPPEDRKLAQEQKFCVVESEHRLGSMGKPVKILVKDQPVFLCCGGCKKSALKDPEKTLATVKDLKAKARGSSHK
jgi:hypothetical protein